MPKKAASEEITKSSTVVAETLAPKWAEIIIRQEGKVVLPDTLRSFSIALRAYLRSTGELKSAPRAPTFDSTNLLKAMYFTFSKVATKGNNYSPKLDEVLYGTLANLEVPPVDMGKARKLVDGLLRVEGGRFIVALVNPKRPFEGAIVRLNGAPTMPEKFASWEEMNSAKEEKPAEVKANGKGKGKGKGKEATA